MSQLQVNRINDASGGVLAPISSVMRNRIINGAMVIDQRNAGASQGTTTLFSNYTLDRWQAQYSAVSKFTTQQNAGSVTPPTGFTNYLGVTSSSAYSVGTNEAFGIAQYIEGFNSADLAWGTANAATVTLSFWVRSSLTGTFGGTIRNSAGNRSYPFSYTISAANTWEQKTLTIAGDTTGTWVGATNGIGIQIAFNLGSGSGVSGTANAWAGSGLTAPTGAQSIVGTNGATFYITGVQLEKGTQATSFEYRQYGTELQLCQRYCLIDTNNSNSFIPFGNGLTANTTTGYVVRQMPVPLRSSPSVTVSGNNVFSADVGATAPATTVVAFGGFSSSTFVRVSVTVAAGFSAGQPLILVSDGTTSLRTIIYTSEL
jgi:hypothetical protein